jgi:hypothetical protein
MIPIAGLSMTWSLGRSSEKRQEQTGDTRIPVERRARAHDSLCVKTPAALRGT